MHTAWWGCYQIRLRLALAAAVTLAPMQAQAGLLDFLFGNRQPEPVVAPSSPTPQLPMKHRKAQARIIKSKPAKPQVMKAVRETPIAEIVRQLAQIKELAEVAEERGFTAAFMQDPTLRSGDIVVTSTGIAIFQGGDVSQRKLAQFKPLAASRFKRRKDLLALQRASGFDLAHLSPGVPMSPLVIHARGNRPSPPLPDTSAQDAQEADRIKSLP